ncbi:NUDIX hydrolase [Paenibacillus sp. TAF58]
MIAQGIIIQGNSVLMVKQFVQRGDIVWNFPGGGIEESESPEEACVREVKEETGYVIQITKLLYELNGKYTYLAEIIGGKLFLDIENESNQDIIEIAWIDLDDNEKFDTITTPILNLYLKEEG